eukprot:6188404-Pleurochrysis_carterae.AAC.2
MPSSLANGGELSARASVNILALIEHFVNSQQGLWRVSSMQQIAVHVDNIESVVPLCVADSHERNPRLAA